MPRRGGELRMDKRPPCQYISFHPGQAVGAYIDAYMHFVKSREQRDRRAHLVGYQLLFVEAILVDDLHLLDNCRLSGFAGACEPEESAMKATDDQENISSNRTG